MLTKKEFTAAQKKAAEMIRMYSFSSAARDAQDPFTDPENCTGDQNRGIEVGFQPHTELTQINAGSRFQHYVRI